MDGDLFRPWALPEQWLYLPMSEYLAGWSRSQPPQALAVTVVGRQRDERSHQLRDVFSRASIPFAFRGHDTPAGLRSWRGRGWTAPRRLALTAPARGRSGAESAGSVGGT